VAGAATLVSGGDAGWPKTPPSDGRDLGVRATMLLLLDRGRGFGVLCTLCAIDRGCFLIVDTGRASEDVLLGVPAAVLTLALTLLAPGAVMDIRADDVPSLFGVAGAWKEPSLVLGLLLLLDIAEAGRKGGGILLSALKKLDLRRPLLCAGEEGSCERLSIVRSESDGRDFFFAAGSDSTSGSLWSAQLGSGSSSRYPALEPALEDAREADLKPSRLPSASSSLLVSEVVRCGGGLVFWRDGGRAYGRLKTGSLEEVAAFGPKLGMPLTRLVEEASDARLGAEGGGAAAAGVLERTSDARDVFFWRLDCGGGRDKDDTDGFLRSCSVDSGARS